MKEEVEYIEVCIGIGMNQLTPQYIKIPNIGEVIQEDLDSNQKNSKNLKSESDK